MITKGNLKKDKKLTPEMIKKLKKDKEKKLNSNDVLK